MPKIYSAVRPTGSPGKIASAKCSDKSQQRPNISALAREFRVARRTIIRDLQELIRRGQLKPEIYPEWENPVAEE